MGFRFNLPNACPWENTKYISHPTMKKTQRSIRAKICFVICVDSRIKCLAYSRVISVVMHWGTDRNVSYPTFAESGSQTVQKQHAAGTITGEIPKNEGKKIEFMKIGKKLSRLQNIVIFFFIALSSLSTTVMSIWTGNSRFHSA